MAVLGAPRSGSERLILVINRGKLQHLFLSLLPHDTQPGFLGSHTHATNTGRQLFGRRLNVVTQQAPSFQHRHKQIIVFINSCRGDAPTQAD